MARATGVRPNTQPAGNYAPVECKRCHHLFEVLWESGINKTFPCPECQETYWFKISSSDLED
jgi:hypothetical protein